MKRAGLAAIGLVALLYGATMAGSVLRAAEIDFGTYRALVIGINDYQHINKLETAVNDASAMHDLLRRQYGFESTLLLNPKRYEMVRALDRLRAELTENDNLLIYYAGHGFLDEETEAGFWLPADAEADSQANWVDLTLVTRTLKASVANHALVISDSCYSGRLTRAAPVKLRVGAERLAELKRLNSKRARTALTSGGPRAGRRWWRRRSFGFRPRPARNPAAKPRAARRAPPVYQNSPKGGAQRRSDAGIFRHPQGRTRRR